MIRFFFVFGFLICGWSAFAGTDKKVVFTVGKKVYDGTITIPDGEGPFPLMVLIPFEELQGKDQQLDIKDPELVCLYPQLEGQKIRIAKEISEYYSEKGIAVFRYDRNPINFVDEDQSKKSPLDEISIIQGGIQFCLQQPEIDSTIIILWGNGVGGQLAYRVAEMRKDIDYLITYSLPQRLLSETLESKIRYSFQHCGDQGEEEMKEVLVNMKETLTGAQNNKIGAGELVAGQFPAFWRGLINLAKENTSKFEKNTLPALAIYGSLDFEVTDKDVLIAKESAPPKTKVEFLSGTNRFLNDGKSAHVHPLIFKTIDRFLMKNQR